MPSITITFQQLGITAIKRSEKGVLGMIIVDTSSTVKGEHILTNVTDIASGKLANLANANKAQIQLAFMGYTNPPRKIMVYVVDGTEKTLNDALTYFATQEFDYLVAPHDITDAESQTVVSWVKSERQNNHLAKAVLPIITADTEGVVNFVTEEIVAGTQTFTTAEYCSRIAGLIAGTPMTISATYAPLPEVTNCSRLTKAERNEAIDAGKFIIWHDGKQVLTGRAVNSLTTTSQEKGDKFKKIKLVEVMDMIANDIRTTTQENYIGKYANSYDNKCLLITAIQGYLKGLEQSGILARGTSDVEIDVESNGLYLTQNGIDTSEMTEQQIKEADTGSSVFLLVRVTILDAIEDITIRVTI